MQSLEARLYAALRDGGMAEVPDRFSVAPLHQVVPAMTLADIDHFVRVFDRVTTRRSWQEAATASALEVAGRRRQEVCFFSAWDFHIPDDRPDDWQLIEFNDNGSGFLFAALLNRVFYQVSGMDERNPVEPPPDFASFAGRIAAMVANEATQWFGRFPHGLFLILDDAESLRSGRFRDELFLLRDLFHQQGWPAEVGSPEELRSDGGRLRWRERDVAFVVNRSTDFMWKSEALSTLGAAFREGCVYVAPNPFTYATRSDKRLLEWLSRNESDAELGIRPHERRLLSRHVPETWLVRAENIDDLVARKQELVFKPVHGFAGRGILPSAQVGRTRLRRLLRKGDGYVAQRRIPKQTLTGAGGQDPRLWTDLRLWAYRGDRFLLSGRASRRPDGIDLSPPGGWLPTFAAG